MIQSKMHFTWSSSWWRKVKFSKFPRRLPWLKTERGSSFARWFWALNIFTTRRLYTEIWSRRWVHHSRKNFSSLQRFSLQNLLLAEGDVIKVADLGVCNEFLGDDASIDQRTATGTPAFRAPETLSGQKIYFDGKSADIWSLGVTLFAFVYGDVPFKSHSIPVLYEQIKNEDISFPMKPAISDDLKNLIELMLNKDPEGRINMQQIKVSFKSSQVILYLIPLLKDHKWITQNGRYPMPSEEEHCQRLVQISEEDISSVVKSIPKLDTLILIKKMLKNHSFQNPFLSAIGNSSVAKSLASRISRLERFQNSRSNSAPGNYQNLAPCGSGATTGELESPVD